MNKENFSKRYKVIKFIYKNYTVLTVENTVLSIISTIAEIFSVTILGKLLDSAIKILSEQDTFDIHLFIETDTFKYIVLILVLKAIIQICQQANNYVVSLLTERITQDTKYEMISKISQSNMQDVEEDEFQKLVTYAPTFSIPKIVEIYTNFSNIMSRIIRGGIAIYIVYETMGWSALFIILFTLPEIMLSHIKRKNLKDFQDESVGKIKFIVYVQELATTITNFAELRVNNIFNHIKRRDKEEYEEYIDGYSKAQSSFYTSKTVTSILGQVFKYAYIVYSLSVCIIKKMSVGTFKALYDYIDIAYDSIYNIFNSLSIISVNIGYISGYFDLIEYSGFEDRYQGSKKLSKNTPLLEFHNLTFSYPDNPETKILKNLNLTVKPGEKVAFLGEDGSGKSSTVKILTGMYEVEKPQQYLLDGIPTKELARGELKKKISVIFQNFINYNFSVKENVVISGQRKNVDNDLYNKVSNISQLKKLKKRVGLQDSSIVGKTFPSGKDLSAGDWQRLAIARMLYRNKNIFIMDEPFTYIDDFSAESILDNVLKYIGKERSVIYITRNTKFLEKFDRVYYFENGSIVESGSLKELMKKKGKLYEQYKK
ncbi:ABC transporter ATP-binding protein [bacterium]|nr:ABC transporter ATP-binding protein [bacterium]